MIGVNKNIDNSDPPIETLKIDADVEREQVARLKDLKSRRDADRHGAALKRLEQDARDGANVMPGFGRGR